MVARATLAALALALAARPPAPAAGAAVLPPHASALVFKPCSSDATDALGEFER